MRKMLRLMLDESGATAIEYGLIAAAMGLALIGVLPTLQDALVNQFQNLANGLNDSDI
ncbi:MAG: Flp family type IVb pilin [Hyphomicrobiales bacterium]